MKDVFHDFSLGAIMTSVVRKEDVEKGALDFSAIDSTICAIDSCTGVDYLEVHFRRCLSGLVDSYSRGDLTDDVVQVFYLVHLGSLVSYFDDGRPELVPSDRKVLCAFYFDEEKELKEYALLQCVESAEA